LTDAVVDASVVVKWAVAEEHSEQALALLKLRRLVAPAHWLSESVNAVWGKAHRGEITTSKAESAAGLLLGAPVTSIPLAGLVKRALALSLATGVTGVTVYDTLYVALAFEREVEFITADRKLARKFAGDPIGQKLITWVGDL